MLYSFPRAILHVDGDSFFASCEVAKNPALRGKAVITGQERGIVSSMTYEAKARGVTRAMKLSDVRKVCPDAVILPSDYETYALYSKRMYDIVRRYTSDLEEYSIDECFADITGLQRPNNMSYEEMARRIKHELDTELGMTFSIGLSVNKVLAKIASKWKKPSGLTIIPGNEIETYLAKVPVRGIWGVGPNTSAYMNKLGIVTAFHFAQKDPLWVAQHFSKPFLEIHRELRGEFVHKLTFGEKNDYASISKTRTFTPPSKDPVFIFSQLSKNIENACIKLRRHTLFTKKVAIFLKTQDFKYYSFEFELSQFVSVPQEILPFIREKFLSIYQSGLLYRATGVTFMDLQHTGSVTGDLFGNSLRIEKFEKIYEAVDQISHKYGKYSLFLGSSFMAMKNGTHLGDRGVKSDRTSHHIRGESNRKRIGIPFLGTVV